MKKISKLKTIVKAFSTTSDIDQTILDKRREICKGCDFNSLNIDDSGLSLTEKARKKLAPNEPFCTACGCQVNEKTSQETEECGLSEKGLEPKWNRVKVQTQSKLELDLINLSLEDINVDLTSDGKAYQINFGTLEKRNINEIKFLLKSKNGVQFDMTKFKPSCGACTSADYIKKNLNTYEITLSLNTNNISKGTFSKVVYLSYKLNSVSKNNQIKLIGNVK